MFLGEGIPTKVSRSNKTKKDLFDNLEPTLNSIKDIEDALKVWSQYWPILNQDS